MSKNKRNRPYQKSVLLDEESMAIVAHYQSTQNLPFNGAVKLLIKRHKIKQYEPKEKVTLVKLLYTLGQYSKPLNDLAQSGCENCVLLLEEIRDLLIEIRNAIFQRLGRKP